MQNKRMSRRLQVSIPVSLDVDGERIEGMAREVGDGGIRFECSSELSPSTTGVFELKATAELSSIKLKGEVLYKYPPLPGFGVFQYGVRFVETDSAQREALANLMRVLTLRERYAPRRGALIVED